MPRKKAEVKPKAAPKKKVGRPKKADLGLGADVIGAVEPVVDTPPVEEPVTEVEIVVEEPIKESPVEPVERDPSGLLGKSIGGKPIKSASLRLSAAGDVTHVIVTDIDAAVFTMSIGDADVLVKE